VTDPLEVTNDDGEGQDPPGDMLAPPAEATDAEAVENGHQPVTTEPVNGDDQVTPEPLPPTQVRRPWRATARTLFQAAIALATLLPFVVTNVYGNDDDIPAAVTQVLVVSAGFARIMATPQVEKFLRRFLPFLAATPKEG
jgi:hypothetical protein